MTERLADGGVHVVVVERDSSALQWLAAVAHMALQVDLDHVGEEELANHGPFDTFVACDVLEHLVDPGRVLNIVSHCLVGDGI